MIGHPLPRKRLDNGLVPPNRIHLGLVGGERRQEAFSCTNGQEIPRQGGTHLPQFANRTPSCAPFDGSPLDPNTGQVINKLNEQTIYEECPSCEGDGDALFNADINSTGPIYIDACPICNAQGYIPHYCEEHDGTPR